MKTIIFLVFAASLTACGESVSHTDSKDGENTITSGGFHTAEQLGTYSTGPVADWMN